MPQWQRCTPKTTENPLVVGEIPVLVCSSCCAGCWIGYHIVANSVRLRIAGRITYFWNTGTDSSIANTLANEIVT